MNAGAVIGTTPAVADTQKPTTPGTPVVSNVDAYGNATVTVPASTDNVAVAGYAVFVDDQPEPYETSVTNVISLSELSHGLHNVTVRAFDSAGNYSDEVSATDKFFINLSSDYFNGLSSIIIPDLSISGESPLSSHTDVISSFDGQFDDVDYPFGHVTKVILPGTTIQGNSLYAYEFSPSFWKKTFIILGGVHGTEINTHSPLRKFLEHFVANPAMYPDMSETRLVVAPMMNPDGFRLTRGNGNTPPVDINRNFLVGGSFPTSWADFSTGGDFYKGASAFSEVESQAIRWMFETKYPDVSVMIDFHNLGSNSDANFSVLEHHSLSNNPATAVATALHKSVDSSDIWYMQDKTVTPNPTTITYAQQRKIWSTGFEIGIGNTDTSTNDGMTKSVKAFANVVYEMNALDNMVLSTKKSPYLLSIQRHHLGLSIPTTASYATLDGLSITHTPVVDSTLVGLYSGTMQPGGDGSTIFIAPEVYQGSDNADDAISEGSMIVSDSGSARRGFYGSFNRDVVAGTPIVFGIKTKTLNPNGTRKLARLGILGLLLPKSGISEPTFFTDQYVSSEVFNYEFEGSVDLANNSTYYDIPEVENNIEVKVGGILVIQIEVEIDCGDSGTLYISSASGNGLPLIGNEYDSDQRSKNERYIDQRGRKETLKSVVVQQCLPSSVNAAHLGVQGTQKHKIGLGIKIASGFGQAVLKRYKLRCNFIEAAIGHDQMEWHVHTATSPVQIF